ncbi:hypothetical protein AB2L27_01280 [Kineococcus sp. LSe6-4]|uniref:Histidine kinase n=1 Tax=Kineococcus halophytocola TaxID=3234027 RepID=A0ABV4GVS2_9ACTN
MAGRRQPAGPRQPGRRPLIAAATLVWAAVAVWLAVRSEDISQVEVVIALAMTICALTSVGAFSGVAVEAAVCMTALAGVPIVCVLLSGSTRSSLFLLLLALSGALVIAWEQSTGWSASTLCAFVSSSAAVATPTATR